MYQSAISSTLLIIHVKNDNREPGLHSRYLNARRYGAKWFLSSRRIPSGYTEPELGTHGYVSISIMERQLFLEETTKSFIALEESQISQAMFSPKMVVDVSLRSTG